MFGQFHDYFSGATRCIHGVTEIPTPFRDLGFMITIHGHTIQRSALYDHDSRAYDSATTI